MTAALVSSHEVSKAKSGIRTPNRNNFRAATLAAALVFSREQRLLRGRDLFSLCHFLFRYWRTFSEESDAFEQIHGPLELRIMGINHPFAILFVKTLDAAR